jgi:hypothetical protein
LVCNSRPNNERGADSEAMNKALVKSAVAKPRMPKRPSTSIGTSTTYRVSKAQSLRLRAFDKRAEAAEVRKVRIAAKKAKGAIR